MAILGPIIGISRPGMRPVNESKARAGDAPRENIENPAIYGAFVGRAAEASAEGRNNAEMAWWKKRIVHGGRLLLGSRIAHNKQRTICS